MVAVSVKSGQWTVTIADDDLSESYIGVMLRRIFSY